MNPASFSKQDLPRAYQEHIQPFWQQHVQQGHFAGVAGIKIAYACAIHPQARASLVISSGRIEGYLKYQELVYDFYQQGYSVFIHDHRGQGLSGRMCDNRQLGHVADFADYVTDFKTFYQQVIQPNSPQPPVLLCHSMGSAIGALYLLDYPQDFARVVFCAPMFGVRPALPDWLGRVLIRTHAAWQGLLGGAPRYFFMQGRYRDVPFKLNLLTSDEARYRQMQVLYQQCPQLQLGGPTGGWLAAAVDTMSLLQQRAAELRLPVLILQAGKDQIVDNNKQNTLAARLPNGNLHKFANSKHELLMEEDDIRSSALVLICQFFDA